MTAVDLRYLDPPLEVTVTDKCVYEVLRLGTADQCGEPLPDDADEQTLFCRYHDGAVDRGDITWDEYQSYRAHYGV